MNIYFMLVVNFSFLVYMLKLNYEILIELELIDYTSTFFSLSFIFDSMSFIFLFTVMIIFMSIYKYSYIYLMSEKYLKRFILVLKFFVLAMMLMILSGNFFFSIIGWDGLGMISMVLIMYFHSQSSLKASLLTFLLNRFGDCCFIICIGYVCLLSNNLLLMNSYHLLYMFSFMLVITAMTKSAQMPFSSWLPAAMEAPTPVSSLVHSSTLVTAGIYLLIRFNNAWIEDQLSLQFLKIISLLTLMLASMSALLENDMKKIIALSTLSQLGFIMFNLSMKLLMAGFFHLIMHAFFKALLFMSAGYMIHSSESWQDIRILSLSKSSPLILMIFGFASLALSGMPYLSGFYSKDLILDSLHSKEMLLIVLIIFSFFLTSLYSLRLLRSLILNYRNWGCMNDDSKNMIYSMLPLVILSCISGSMMKWYLMNPMVFVNNSKILMFILIMLISNMFWYKYKVNKTSLFFDSKWFLNPLISYIPSTFFPKVKIYLESSDLSSIPIITINKVNFIIYSFSNLVSKNINPIILNLDLFMFMMLIFFVM